MKDLLKRNKRLVIIGVMIFAFAMIIIGSSYAFFTYNKDVIVADLTTGSINISFSNNVQSLSLTNAVPTSDEDGMAQLAYMDFSITGTVDTEPIYYEVDIVPKTGNTLPSRYVKVYLTDQNDNVITNVERCNRLPSSTKNVGSNVLVKDVFNVSNGENTIVARNYRLRIWLDENYSANTAKTFSFDLKLYAQNEDFEVELVHATFDLGTNVNGKMKKLSSNDSSAVNSTVDNLIKKIQFASYISSADDIPSSRKQTNNIVSSSTSDNEIYMWYDSGTIYWWSESPRPTLNTNSDQMFRRLNKLEDISGISYFDASGATSINDMFGDCYVLSDLSAIANWDMSNISSMDRVFVNDYALTNVDSLSNWDTANVGSMTRLFDGCSGLVSMDGIKNWNVSYVQSVIQMFNNCSNLISIDLGNWEMIRASNSSNMIAGTSTLVKIKTPKAMRSNLVIDLPDTFYDTSDNAYTTLTNDNVAKSIWLNNKKYVVIFEPNGGYGQVSYQRIPLGVATNLNTNTFTMSGHTFAGWNTESDGTGTNYSDGQAVTDITNSDTISLYAQWNRNMAEFDTGSNVNAKMKTLAANGVTKRNVDYDTTIKKILYASDISSADDIPSSRKQSGNIVSSSTSDNEIYMWYDDEAIYWWSESPKPTLNSDASQMFRRMSALTDISGIADFDAGSATSLEYFFAECSVLSNIDALENWDVHNVGIMNGTFGGVAITNVNKLSGWNTAQVGQMNRMFEHCTSLTSMEGIKDWNVSYVQQTQLMFNDCTSLATLDMGNWSMTRASSAGNMLSGMTALTSIRTPKAMRSTLQIDLPTTFYDSLGNPYTTLTNSNVDKSIWLTSTAP